MPRMYHEPEQPVDRGSVLCAAQRLPRLTTVPQPALARYFKRSGARVTNAGDGMSHHARLCVHSPPPVTLHTPTASTRMHRVRYSNVAVRSGPTSLCAQRMDASQLRACDQQKLDRPVPHNRCQCPYIDGAHGDCPIGGRTQNTRRCGSVASAGGQHGDTVS